MRTETAVTIRRQDYAPPAYLVESVELGFDLDLQNTLLAAQFQVRRNPASAGGDLTLLGRQCPLVWIEIDGRRLSKSDYCLQGESLTIPGVGAKAQVRIVTRLNPEKNTSMMGLFASGGNFFTQCEAEGFRRITWFPDRPDVMSKYTVMLRADKQKFPVLLSNGNLIDSGDLADGRHYAKWEDPFAKPSYLFALVAGKLAHIEETITTASGKQKLLQVYVEKRDLKKAAWAMESLKKAISWDETRFGLELDLERFMVVATSDFNMGAMENKGLNIFNTSAVLAHKKTQTDADFARVESVVGHEYFHNWTGNRVTCRDWFQLTLKEGLTVFRDQEFSADVAAQGLDAAAAASARALLRIEQVRDLRNSQFSEDAGPMAHPIRPESFQDIANFYTATVYEKGAEVIRMQHTLIGDANFRKGMDLYFARHDGTAVTCDDFVQAMQDASGVDLTQFKRWYSQAGTPQVQARGAYDAKAQTWTLHLKQHCPKVGVENAPGTPEKLPFHIPFAIGLLDQHGKDMPLHLAGKHGAATTQVLDFKQAEQSFVFKNVPHEPVPSLLRGYSAPVQLDWQASDAQLAFLLAHDADPFSRWEAGQQLATRHLIALTDDALRGHALTADQTIARVFGTLLADKTLDAAFKAAVLALPDEVVIGQQMPVLAPAAIAGARLFMRQHLAQAHQDAWAACYGDNQTPGKYASDPIAAGKRALKNLALSYWLESGDPAAIKAAKRQYKDANNMTDRIAALSCLFNIVPHESGKALSDFYKRFKDEALVVDKWFQLQATSRHASAQSVGKLAGHKAFTLKNPNRMRSLLFGFMMANQARFHAADGSGYALWADMLPRIDKLNPEVAARAARAMDRWRKLTPDLRSKAKAAIEQMNALQLSKPVAEVLGKALAN